MAWTVPRTWAAAEFVTETLLNTHLRDNLNYLNDTRVKYAQITSSVSSITTEVDVVTAPAFTPISATRLLMVRFNYKAINGNTVGDILTLRIKEGATQFQQWDVRVNVGGGADHQGGSFWVNIPNPTAAAHTYKVTAQRTAGAGTINLTAAATAPAQITVEDVGAA